MRLPRSMRRGNPVHASSLSARQHNQRGTRAVMEAAESRVLLSTSYTVTEPWSFANGTDGAFPMANLVADGSGNLFGTTTSASGDTFKATIFEIPVGTTNLTTLHTFTFNSGSGQANISPLVYDGSGHLFGTTNEGGANEEGSVFEVDATQPTPVVTTIASFDPGDNLVESGNQGALPLGKLAVDGSGNVYGATFSGGADGDGTIFEVANPTGGSPSIHTLASFDNTNNGSEPTSGVVYYSGDIYGTSTHGPSNGADEIFKYDISSQNLTEQVSFAGDEDVAGGSINGLIVDSNGDLFTSSSSGVHAQEEGSIFEVAPGATTYTTLATLTGQNQGPDTPIGDLTIGSDGNIYGTTSAGGANSVGTIFEVDKTTHVVTPLASLDPATSGSAPNGGLLFVGNNILGTASAGGSHHDGTVFELTAAGPPAKLVITSSPGNQVASGGLSGNVVVDVEDASGNLITNDTSNVTLSVATPSGTSFGAGSQVTVPAVGGVATFSNLVLSKAGTYTLSAADTDGATILTPGTSTSFTITHATAAKLAFAVEPANTSVNTADSPAIVVDVEDQFGNLVTNDASAVSLSVATGPSTSISGNTVAAVGGVATFNDVTFTTAGNNYTLSAADSALTAATSTVFTVNGSFGAATKLVFVTQPTNTTAGNIIAPPVTVEVEDASGNLIATDGSTVTLSLASNPTNATLDGTFSATVVNGIATFSNLSITTAGTYTLGATDTENGGLTTSTSSSFIINPAANSQIAITNTPTVTPGNPTTVTTGVEDQYGNVNTSDNSSGVTLQILNPDGTTTTLGPVTVQNGVATFSLALANQGAYSFSANSGSFSTSTSSAPVTLTYTVPTLVFAQPIGTLTAGQKAAAFNVTLYNPSGVIHNAKTKVNLVILSGPTGSKIYGPAHATVKNGTATFKGIYFKVAGTYQLAANAATYATATSTMFNVIPAAAKKLTFTQQPTPNPVTHGSAFSTNVKVADAYGNAISGAAITLSLSKVSSDLAGVLSETTVNGAADFTGLTISAAGNFTLDAADGKLKAKAKTLAVS